MEAPAPLSLDTTLVVERVQIAGWRRMTAAEKATAITAMTQAVYDLAWAGARYRHPDASDRELFLRVAIAVLGEELAAAAYPDAATFIRP